jgi:hypothetical protein
MDQNPGGERILGRNGCGFGLTGKTGKGAKEEKPRQNQNE